MPVKLEDRLLIEWLREGKWYGTTNQSRISDSLRNEALEHLQLTPDRYYYPPHFRNTIRLSFAETV